MPVVRPVVGRRPRAQSTLAASPSAGRSGRTVSVSAPRFELAIAADLGQVVVGVCGDLDLSTVGMLRGVVDVLIDEGHQDVVLDLAELAHLGAAGLGAVAHAAGRLRADGGRLTLRAVPALPLRLLDVVDMTDLVDIEPRPPGPPLGPVQRPGDHSFVGDGSLDVALLSAVASIPSSNEVVDGALDLVTELALATVAGADGVSVSLRRRGTISTVASSNETIERMDRHQYETGQGPCLAAAAEGSWYHVESLSEERRWPAFTPLALDQGIASILSSPLIASGQPVGALNIYSNVEGAFGPNEQEVAGRLAEQASRILAGARVAGADTSSRADALLSREVIAQARGVLMARHHISAEAAAARLHQSARAGGITVKQFASDVTASTGPASDLRRPRP